MIAWPLRIPQEQLRQRFNIYAVLGGVFQPRECREIIDLVLAQEQRHNAKVHQDQSVTYIDAVRKGDVCWMDPDREQYRWIYERCTAAVQQVNGVDWRFDLDYIDPLQFTCYDNTGDHFGWHIDNASQGDNTYRKLSFSIQLSTPQAYEGGVLEILTGQEPQPMPQEQGTFIAFPSIITHRVTPITRGKRYSLVGWCTGPQFR